MTYDVVVIGCGLGGLECAAILARAGKSVLVLEQGAQIGGCLQCYRRGKETFDTGFHYVGGLGEGQSLHSAFRYLGLTELPWRQMDADGFDRVSLDGTTYKYAQGYDKFAERMADYFPKERKAIRVYVDMMRLAAQEQLAALSPKPSDNQEATDMMLETSAWRYMTETFRDPNLIAALCGTSLKMELRRASLPLFTFLHGNSSYVESSWRLLGGGAAMAEALAANVKRQGGTIVCGARVEQLVEVEGQISRAVCANGESYEGRLFVSDIHPSLTCALVKTGEKMKPSFRNRMSQCANTAGMFTVSLRVKPQTLPYFNYNQYIYRDNNVWDMGEDNLPVRGILVSCRPPEDGSAYTRQVDLLTPMAWSVCQKWEDTTVGRRGSDYEAMKERVANECIAIAESSFPGIRETSAASTSTPLTWRDYTLTPYGSAYGMRKDFRSPLATVLSPRTPIPDLLLTGQSLMLHGVHGVTMAAYHTCACVLGKDKVWSILSGK